MLVLRMTCHDLAQRLAELRPDLTPVEIARLCLVLLAGSPHPERLDDDRQLMSAWQNASFRLEAATDQHAAVVAELEALLGDGPIEFTPDQLWTLLRAVKVQSQLLELFAHENSLA